MTASFQYNIIPICFLGLRDATCLHLLRATFLEKNTERQSTRKKTP